MSETNAPCLRVGDFKGSADLSDEAFGERFGEGFLLHHGELGGAASVDDLSATALAVPRHAMARAPGAAFLIFPIRLSGRTSFSDFVAVGRAANNDVVLVDPSVSLFHALIKISVGTSGRPEFLVQDAASRNGSFVNDRPVPRQESHEQAALAVSGTSVRFGSVELTFMHVQELRKLLAGVQR